MQFHPEVVHTPEGKRMLHAFLFSDCKVSGSWTMKGFVQEAEEAIRAKVGEHGRVICGLSGGVDSSVAALLLHRAIVAPAVHLRGQRALRQGSAPRWRRCSWTASTCR